MVDDREFIDLAAKGLKIEAEPFKPLAERLGLSVDEVLARLGRLIEEGKVRRFAASVRHQPMGYSYNSMIVARTDEQHLEEVGARARGIEGVSHCYHRGHPDGDPWCVYVMVHGRRAEDIENAARQVGAVAGVINVEVLASRGELKKTSLSGVSTDLEKYREG